MLEYSVCFLEVGSRCLMCVNRASFLIKTIAESLSDITMSYLLEGYHLSTSKFRNFQNNYSLSKLIRAVQTVKDG